MGIEAYGLVGLFVTLQALLPVLDLGLSLALSREIPRLTARPGGEAEARDLVRTLELFYWAAALVLGLLAFALGPLVARHWLNSEQLPEGVVANAVCLMGLAVAARFPFALYSGVMLGMQRQVVFNALAAGMATVQWVGALVALLLASPTLSTFFSWQIAANALQTVCAGLLLWRLLGRGRAARARASALAGVWRFSAGLAGVTALALALGHMDKLILSRMLPLEAFGYYSLAAVVASAISLAIWPIFLAVLPRLTQLVSLGEDKAVVDLYHAASQLAAVAVWPVAVVVALFSREILTLWAGDPVITENTHRLVSLLTVGAALNAVVHLPYALQLAHGWTRFALCQNAVALALLAPCLVWAAGRYGAEGAAVALIVVNLGYVLVSVPLMHTWLLREQRRAWYLRDIGLPLAGALAGALPLRWLMSGQRSAALTLALVLAAAVATLVVSASAAPLTRQWIKGWAHG
jgi:O-antigen/teichoic acid export membrane protein